MSLWIHSFTEQPVPLFRAVRNGTGARGPEQASQRPLGAGSFLRLLLVLPRSREHPGRQSGAPRPVGRSPCLAGQPCGGQGQSREIMVRRRLPRSGGGTRVAAGSGGSGQAWKWGASPDGSDEGQGGRGQRQGEAGFAIPAAVAGGAGSEAFLHRPLPPPPGRGPSLSFCSCLICSQVLVCAAVPPDLGVAWRQLAGRVLARFRPAQR